MGIDASSLNDKQLTMIDATTRKQMGKRGVTASEALHRETVKLERTLHSNFSSFCKRNGIEPGNSSPVRKTSIAEGTPDFASTRDGRVCYIEFKIFPNKLSRVQEEKIAYLRSIGNTVHVCTESPENDAYAEAAEIFRNHFHLTNQENKK